MKLISMKRSAEEVKADATCAPGEGDAYPYGLNLWLDADALKKLGLTLPAIGGKFTLIANVEVTSTSEYKQVKGDDDCNASLQITEMVLTPATSADAASMLWPVKK